MAWNDAPPKPEELRKVAWNSAPPTKAELGPQLKADVDPGYANTIATIVGQGLTNGFVDEMAGRVAQGSRALGLNMHDGRFKNFEFDTPTLDSNELGKAYTDTRDYERGLQHQANKFHPGISTAAEIAGAMLNPVNRIAPQSLSARLALALGQGGSFGLGNSIAEDAGGQAWDTLKGAGINAIAMPVSTLVSKANIPAMGELLAGVPKDASKNYVKHMDFIDGMAVNNEALPYVEKVQKSVQDTMQAAKTKIGKGVVEAIDTAKVPIDISKAKAAYQDKITALEAKQFKTNADVAEINSLRDDYTKYFGLADDGTGIAKHLPDNLDGRSTFDLQQKLKQAMKPEQAMTPENASSKMSAGGGYRAINDGLDTATNGLSSDAKALYGRQMQIDGEVLPNFETPQKTYSALTNLNAQGKKMFSERLKQLADSGEMDLTDAAEKLQGYRHFAEPSMSPLSSGGTTSTTRTKAGTTINAALGGMIGSIFGPAGATAGAAIGAGTAPLMYNPQTLKAALKANNWWDQNLGAYTPSPETLGAVVPPSVYNMFQNQK